MTNHPFSVADHVVKRLAAWNVRRVFGYSGDGINGVMGALHRAERTPDGALIDFVQAAHEELAGLMAVAHAKFTGEVGVCMVTGGPGAIHLLNALYDAKLDHQPVVAIVGQSALAGAGGSAQQETNLAAILQDVASAYCVTISKPEQVSHAIDRAFRAALGQRSVAVIILPHDVQQELAVEAPSCEHAHQHSAPGFAAPRLVPREAELKRAAAVLAAGSRIAILVGAGALGAVDEVAAMAHRLGAGVAKALLGKAVLPDDLPFVTGAIGWLGTNASNQMMQECDTLLMVGSNLPYAEFLPPAGQARGVQIDIEPRNLALRFPMEVPLAGDAAETLQALLPLLTPVSPALAQARAQWRERIEELTRDSWQRAERQADAPAFPLNPRQVVRALSRRLPERSIVTADAGTAAVWLARDVRLRSGMMASLSGGLATMGCGVPYALAAKLAYPDRFAAAIVGDGAMQMSGLGALIDVVKYWQRWADPRLVILVLNNRDLNFVTWEQRVMDGDPRYAAAQTLPDLPYAQLAKVLGLDGIRIEQPEDVDAALDQAFAADRPFVIDALVDPAVPTLPPLLKGKLYDQLANALDVEAVEGAASHVEAVRRQLQLQEIVRKPD